MGLVFDRMPATRERPQRHKRGDGRELGAKMRPGLWRHPCRSPRTGARLMNAGKECLLFDKLALRWEGRCCSAAITKPSPICRVRRSSSCSPATASRRVQRCRKASPCARRSPQRCNHPLQSLPPIYGEGDAILTHRQAGFEEPARWYGFVLLCGGAAGAGPGLPDDRELAHFCCNLR